MNKKNFFLMLPLLLTIGLLAVSLGSSVEASPLASSSTSCQSYAGAFACRSKGVASTGPSTWGANVQSYMASPAISIDTIGYSYWTVRETCDGDITSQWNYGGTVDHYTSSFWDASAQYKHYCGGSRVGWSFGNHDFHKSGYSHIYPYKLHSQGL